MRPPSSLQGRFDINRKRIFYSWTTEWKNRKPTVPHKRIHLEENWFWYSCTGMLKWLFFRWNKWMRIYPGLGGNGENVVTHMNKGRICVKIQEVHPAQIRASEQSWQIRNSMDTRHYAQCVKKIGRSQNVSMQYTCIVSAAKIAKKLQKWNTEKWKQKFMQDPHKEDRHSLSQNAVSLGHALTWKRKIWKNFTGIWSNRNKEGKMTDGMSLTRLNQEMI